MEMHGVTRMCQRREVDANELAIQQDIHIKKKQKSEEKSERE